MGEALLYGLLLLLFQVVLVIAATWAISRFLIRPILRRWVGDRHPGPVLTLVSWPVAFALVWAAFYLPAQPGRSRFEQLCAEHGKPRIVNRVRVDGFYSEALHQPGAQGYLGHAYKGDPYEKDPFTFVEGPAAEGKGKVRYTWDENKTRMETIVELRSRYGMRVRESRPFHGIEMREKTIYEIGSGKPIAEAALVDFDGGPLPSLVFGSFVKSSCTQAIGPYFDLERNVLRGSPR
jgi:hypothetical protein